MDRWAKIHEHGPLDRTDRDHKRAEFFRDLGVLRTRAPWDGGNPPALPERPCPLNADENVP
jgi:hypothetical protein